ncbi:MAG: hypothetical protein RIB98_12055 [Acidimicrobiales bacterium]
MRSRIRVLRRLVIPTLALGLLAAACGSSPDLDTVVAPDTAETSTTEATVTTGPVDTTTSTIEDGPTATTGITTTAAPPETSTTSTTGAPETTTTMSTTTTTTTNATGECSATGVEAPSTPDELGAEAADTFRAVVDAAVDCDYDGLAVAAGGDITLSFGGPYEVAPYLEDAEQRGDELLRILVQLLAMPPGLLNGPAADTDIWVWPTFWEDDEPATPAEQTAIEAIYGEPFDEVLFEGAYLSHRIGIDVAGDWLFFVAGD